MKISWWEKGENYPSDDRDVLIASILDGQIQPTKIGRFVRKDLDNCWKCGGGKVEVAFWKDIPTPNNNFLFIWLDLNIYELVEDYAGSPHNYARQHKNYNKSRYAYFCYEGRPTIFEQTPEDKLLKELFKK